MLSSEQLKKIVAEARPLIEQQLDLTEQVAGLREVVTSAGGDWSQLKALVKAQIQDERDDSGEGKRVRKILDKADYASNYADMLGFDRRNLNEKNSFAEVEDSNPAFDKWLDEVSERIDPELLIQIIEGSKTAAGRAIIMAAIKVVKAERVDEPNSKSAATTAPKPTPGGPKAEEQTHGSDAGSSAITNPDAAVEKKPSRLAHNQKIAGASPAPATSGEAHEEGAAVGESPTPDPADVSGVSGGGEDVDAPGSQDAVTGAEAQIWDASAAGFTPGSIRYEHAPPEPIVYHEIIRCFPEASNRDFAALVEAIKGGAEIEPILMQGNILLDGRARYTAARQAKADYPVEEYAGDDPLSDIIKLNMASRKLNLVERQSIAKKLIKLCPDREADIGELLDLEQQREAAQ